MTRRITAPELDDALTRLGAALAALSPQERAVLRADMPAGIVALADQVDAARGEAVGLMESAGEGLEGGVGYVPRTSVDEWIRLSAFDALIGWIDGKGRVCMHSPDWRRPEPVFSCAWKPGLVVCTSCMHLLDVAGDADATCDRCGRVCAGIDAGDPIYTSTVFLGGLAFLSAACTSCRPSPTQHEPRPAYPSSHRRRGPQAREQLLRRLRPAWTTGAAPPAVRHPGQRAR